MNFVKGLRLSSKLILSFIIIALVSIVVGVVGILGMNTLSKADEEMYLYNAKPMGTIAVMYDLFATQRINAANMAIFFQSDPEFSQAELESLTEKEQAFDNAFNDYKNWISNEEENTIYENLKQFYYNNFSLCKQNVKAAVFAGDETAIRTAIQAMDDMGSTVSDFLDELNVLNERLGSDKVNANKALSWSRTITLIIVMIGGMALSLILAFAISSLVAKPLTAATRMLSYATKSIENSARELTSSAVSLAEISNEQAASIEEVSATMNQTASMIRQNADNTFNAKELATTAGKMISEAITRADEMKKCMIELATSSEKITKIVSDISSISFQTNILSLNASVEASRAGEAGKSFIVVAEEVRSLAQRSAESAKNTGSIINSNSILTKESGKSSEMVNKSLIEADENAKKVFGLLNEISLASEEQSRGVQQVNITMAEIEKSMQSSAASSEESAAAASTLESLIDDLNGVFQSLEFVVYGNSSHSGHQ